MSLASANLKLCSEKPVKYSNGHQTKFGRLLDVVYEERVKDGGGVLKKQMWSGIFGEIILCTLVFFFCFFALFCGFVVAAFSLAANEFMIDYMLEIILLPPHNTKFSYLNGTYKGVFYNTIAITTI